MLAKDVMTTEVISVTPDAGVQEIAQLMLQRRISALPVIDAEQKLVGIVSEGDLMHREEAETEPYAGSWWLNLFVSSDRLASRFTKIHGQSAADVMTRDPVVVTEDTPLGEIARLLETRHIKRVPVVRDNRVVGIISRANLLHGLATGRLEPAKSTAENDNAVRGRILQAMGNQPWIKTYSVNVTVDDGTVHLWGVVNSEKVRDALTILIEEVSGVKTVANHLGISEQWMFWAE
jgi:CBS domain-containing protein